MPACPACRAEYREGFTSCADCGGPLVEVLPPLPPTGLMPVLETGSYVLAFAFRAFLEDNGIPAEIDNEFAWNHAVGIPTSAIPLVVVVSEVDHAEAAEALAEWSKPAEGGEPWVPAVAASWAAPFATAALLLGMEGRLKPGVLAALAWFSIQIGIVGRGPARLLVAGFVYGGLAAVSMATGIQLGIDWVLAQSDRFIPVRHFVITGPLEETLKLLGPLVFVAKGRLPWAAAVPLAGASALGFATIENLGYGLIIDSPDPAHVFVLRAGSLLHVAETLFVITGPAGGLVPRLFLAALLHGAWNTMAEAEWVWGNLALFGVGLVLLRRSTRLSAPPSALPGSSA